MGTNGNSIITTGGSLGIFGGKQKLFDASGAGCDCCGSNACSCERMKDSYSSWVAFWHVGETPTGAPSLADGYVFTDVESGTITKTGDYDWSLSGDHVDVTIECTGTEGDASSEMTWQVNGGTVYTENFQPYSAPYCDAYSLLGSDYFLEYIDSGGTYNYDTPIAAWTTELGSPTIPLSGALSCCPDTSAGITLDAPDNKIKSPLLRLRLSEGGRDIDLFTIFKAGVANTHPFGTSSFFWHMARYFPDLDFTVSGYTMFPGFNPSTDDVGSSGDHVAINIWARLQTNGDVKFEIDQGNGGVDMERVGGGAWGTATASHGSSWYASLPISGSFNVEQFDASGASDGNVSVDYEIDLFS